jgi:hypothetical protein
MTLVSIRSFDYGALPPPQAQNYMRVAQFADGKSEIVSLLAPPSIYALASKAAPPSMSETALILPLPFYGKA